MSKIVSLSVLGLAALASSAALAVPASAASPTLRCQVIPSRSGAQTGTCGTFTAARSYVIDNALQDGPATGWTWSVPAGTTVVGGCSANSTFCDLSVRAATGDRDFVTTVVFSGGGTLSVDAFLPAVCGTELC
jgi:hypothetical protein